MPEWLWSYADYTTGPYIRFLGFDLFLFRHPFRLAKWGLSADGTFAICGPWFTLYIPGGYHLDPLFDLFKRWHNKG